MTKEEEDEESMFLVEGVPRKRKVFIRDGSLFVDQVTSMMLSNQQSNLFVIFERTTSLLCLFLFIFNIQASFFFL